MGDIQIGMLSVLEYGNLIPFEIKRVYYLHHLVKERKRGEHAHKKLEQFFVCVSGSMKVLLDDGVSKKEYLLSNPNEGLYVSPMIWGSLRDFSSNAVLLVLASELYDESDYYRDYNEFIKATSTPT